MRSRNRLVIPFSGRHAGVWCGCESGEGSLHFSLSRMISLVRNEEASALSRSPREYKPPCRRMGVCKRESCGKVVNAIEEGLWPSDFPQEGGNLS